MSVSLVRVNGALRGHCCPVDVLDVDALKVIDALEF